MDELWDPGRMHETINSGDLSDTPDGVRPDHDV
jgi:hypothetical protein